MKHDLKTLEDILKVVTLDNFENFLIDFRGWLTMHIFIDETRKAFGEKLEIESDDTVLHWIDDGKTNAHIKIEVK